MAQTIAQLNSPGELEEFRQALASRRDPSAPCISICAGAGCLAYGAAEVIEAFAAELKKQKLSAKVDMKGTGCPGFCEKGPVVVLLPSKVFYQSVQLEDVPKIVLYWHMYLAGDCAFEPDSEVDKLVWLPIRDALDRLSYEGEKELVANAVEE